MKFDYCPKNADLGLLLIRIGLASVFIVHGVSKLQGIEGTIGFFAKLGLHPFFAYFVTGVEVIAGLAVLLGVFVQVAAGLLVGVMVFAIYLVKFQKGFLGGYEFDLMLLLVALGIMFIGPGAYALEALRKNGHHTQASPPQSADT
ncbi:DoxX family protein [Candidatus Uhrbacteria bacterium]|nr:DoxX family protein [Candidatus Uhrbacteria bacterium]